MDLFVVLRGGSPEWSTLFYKQPKLGAHLNAFSEKVSLTATTDWLLKLHYQSLEKEPTSIKIIRNLKKIINSDDFLPDGAKFGKINTDGVFFETLNGKLVPMDYLSDGFRSILSLTFELIRQLIECYGSDDVFKYINENTWHIGLPGVVLIDEIDAHLHPSWQTRIGQWFTKYFPNIQFIVTTHSALVCRAAEKGSICRLQAGEDGVEATQISGVEKDRLVYGNILDAYGTEAFGENLTISVAGSEKLQELAQLNHKYYYESLSKEEKAKRNALRAIFPTEEPKI